MEGNSKSLEMVQYSLLLKLEKQPLTALCLPVWPECCRLVQVLDRVDRMSRMRWWCHPCWCRCCGDVGSAPAVPRCTVEFHHSSVTTSSCETVLPPATSSVVRATQCKHFQHLFRKSLQYVYVHAWMQRHTWSSGYLPDHGLVLLCHQLMPFALETSAIKLLLMMC